jgi:hypothetical protein
MAQVFERRPELGFGIELQVADGAVLLRPSVAKAMEGRPGLRRTRPTARRGRREKLLRFAMCQSRKRGSGPQGARQCRSVGEQTGGEGFAKTAEPECGWISPEAMPPIIWVALAMGDG